MTRLRDYFNPRDPRNPNALFAPWMFRAGGSATTDLEDLEDTVKYYDPVGSSVAGAQMPVATTSSGTPVILGGQTAAQLVAQATRTAQAAQSNLPRYDGGPVATPVTASTPVPVDFVDPSHPQRASIVQAVQQSPTFGQQIVDAVNQAALGVPAQTGFGALLGAGIGGPGMGTGALPGQLGQWAQQLFAQAGLPGAAQWRNGRLELTPYDRDGGWREIARDVDQAGRYTAERVLGITQPQLDGIRRLLEHRANQVQATGEHNVLAATEQWRREMAALLRAIALRTGARRPEDFLAVGQLYGGEWRRY